MINENVEYGATQMPKGEGWIAFRMSDKGTNLIIDKTIPVIKSEKYWGITPKIFVTQELAIEAAKNYDWSQNLEGV